LETERIDVKKDIALINIEIDEDSINNKDGNLIQSLSRGDSNVFLAVKSKEVKEAPPLLRLSGSNHNVIA
jgi:hypothetical protein